MNTRNHWLGAKTPLAQLLGAFVVSMFATHSFAQSSPSAYTYATRYDLLGRVTGTIAPDPDGAGPLKYQATRNTYDAAGRLVTVESGELSAWKSESAPDAPANWSTGEFSVYKKVETSYNAQNQKTLEVVKGSDGVATAATQYGYDNVGRLQCTAVRMNPSIYGSLPTACSLGTEGSYGPDRITKNIYNARGELATVQRAVGTSLQQDYATYAYSPNGNRTSVTDARGYKASMEFDGLDRQVKWNFPSATTPGTVDTTNYEQYGYDANSNRTSFRKRDGSTLTYGYDALNRMTSKIVPERSGLDPSFTRDVYYGYDSLGHMTYARFDSASGDGITTSYSGFGEVTGSSTSIGSFLAPFNFQFDADGNRTRITYGDGNYVTYGYDGMDRVNGVYRSGTTTLASYSYNARGLRAGMGGDFATSYAYKPDGRLDTLTNTPLASSYTNQYGFSYNPASQITQMTRSNDAFAWNGAINNTLTYTPNGLNQYTAVGSASPSYDANGNLTSDGATNYVYDVENRLVSASGAKNATLRYDPMGRLYESTGGPAGLMRFAYDGDALVQEFNNLGWMLNRYVHGANAGDDPIAWFVGAGFTNAEQRLIRGDYQGSIVAVSNADSTSILGVNTYDEYGKPGEANQGRFQYTGQTWMPELGLYYYKARMYSPTLGRFMQTDPIGYEDDVNLYAYVGSDPANKTDAKGLEAGCITLGNCGSAVAPGNETKAALTLGAFAALAITAGVASSFLPAAVATSEGEALTGLGTSGAAGGGAAAASSLNQSQQSQAAMAAAQSRAAQAAAQGATRGTSNGLVTTDGQVFTGASTRSGGPGVPTNSQVADAVNSIPPANQSAYSGCCSEINSLSNALNAGANPQGAVSITVYTSEPTIVVQPCATCAAVHSTFGIIAGPVP